MRVNTAYLFKGSFAARCGEQTYDFYSTVEGKKQEHKFKASLSNLERPCHWRAKVEPEIGLSH